MIFTSFVSPLEKLRKRSQENENQNLAFIFLSPMHEMVFFQRTIHWSFCSFSLMKKNQKIKKIRTASPHATAPPRIFFLPALGCCPVILIDRFVKNLFCITVSKSISGFPGKIGNRIADNQVLVIS